MNTFKEIKPLELTENPFQQFGKDWFLITAEKDGVCNTMTLGWGGLGVLWQKDVVFAAVRPERYTNDFLDVADTFSLTIFDNSYRKMLGYCGTISGRDENKIEKSGLTLIYDGEIPYFDECRLSIHCRKIMATEFCEADFVDQTEFVNKWYGGVNKKNGEGGGYHLLYIAEIEKILVRE